MNMQDPNERRVIRHEYRKLLQETNENKDDLCNPESEKLHDTLNVATQLFGRVRMPREAALDSQLIAVLAEMGRQQAHQLQTEFVVFSPNEFTTKLSTFLRPAGLQENGTEPHVTGDMWENLGSIAQPCFKKPPSLNCMYGAFERGPPKKKPVRTREPKDKEVRGKTVPKQMTNTGMKEQERREATTAEVEHILSILHLYYKRWNNMPICFFEFVCNPESYGQTVENIFYTSFLIRDGLARVFLDDEGLPVIEPVSDKENQPTDRISQQRHQVVLAITIQEWQDIIKTFKIEKPLIRTRSSVSTN